MLPIELSRGDRELIFSFTLVLLQVSIILVILHAGSLYGWNAVAYESASNHKDFYRGPFYRLRFSGAAVALVSLTILCGSSSV
jgi:hypothetical protein